MINIQALIMFRVFSVTSWTTHSVEPFTSSEHPLPPPMIQTSIKTIPSKLLNPATLA